MTDLGIVNYALRRLGAQPAASMADTGKNARAAIDSYPLVKGKVLRLFPWPILTVRATLQSETDLAWVGAYAYAVDDRCSNGGKLYQCITAGDSAAAGGPAGTATDITDGTAHWRYLGTFPSNTGFSYTFALPSDCLRILNVQMVGFSYQSGPEENRMAQYRREGPFVNADIEDAVLVYMKVNSEEDWDDELSSAVGLLLASEISYYVTGKPDRAAPLYQEFLQIVGAARDVAALEASQEPKREPGWTEV